MEIYKMWRIIVVSLWIIFILASIFSVLNQNHTTPITDTGSNELSPIPHPDSTQTQPTVNPDGTKNYTVDLSLYISWKAELGGYHFSSRKSLTFFFATLLQKFSSEFMKQLRDNYLEIMLVLIAFTTIPEALLYRKKPCIQD